MEDKELIWYFGILIEGNGFQDFDSFNMGSLKSWNLNLENLKANSQRHR